METILARLGVDLDLEFTAGTNGEIRELGLDELGEVAGGFPPDPCVPLF